MQLPEAKFSTPFLFSLYLQTLGTYTATSTPQKKTINHHPTVGGLEDFKKARGQQLLHFSEHLGMKMCTYRIPGGTYRSLMEKTHSSESQWRCLEYFFPAPRRKKRRQGIGKIHKKSSLSDMLSHHFYRMGHLWKILPRACNLEKMFDDANIYQSYTYASSYST